MSIKEYINSLSSEKKDTVKKIISVIQRKLPKGFNEQMNYITISLCDLILFITNDIKILYFTFIFSIS